MKKVFISQPMKGKTDNEILLERDRAIKVIKETINDDVEFVDSFFNINDGVPNGINKPLWFLAKSIALLSTADIAYFISGWNQARGCKIEHECAAQYGIAIITED